MMTDKNRNLEENIARLMRAAVGPEVRPSGEVRERVLRRLATQLRAKRAATVFPVGILVLLAGILALLAVCWAADVLAIDASRPIGPPLIMPLMLTLTLALNLIWVPIAGTVIVIRSRRNVC